MAFTWGSALRIALLLLLMGAVATACFTLPVEKLKDEETTAMEEQIPVISHAKRDQQRISCQPKLVDMIQFVFQSINCPAVTKEKLVHKLIWNNFEFTDTNEVEEQLTLLLDLVPEWITEEKSESGGDLLVIHINKMSNPDSIPARLEAAN